MSQCLSRGNDTHHVIEFSVCDDDQLVLKPAESAEPVLTVKISIIKNSHAPGIADNTGAVEEIHAMLAEIFPPFHFIPFELDGHCSYILELQQAAAHFHRLRSRQVQKRQFAGKGVLGLSEIGADFRLVWPGPESECIRVGLSAAPVYSDRRCHADMDHSEVNGEATIKQPGVHTFQRRRR